MENYLHILGLNEIDESVVKQSIEEYEKEMENMKFNNALRAVWTIISRSNKYIDETAPWVLAKDEAKKDELGNVMVHLAENIRITAVLLQPYLTHGPKEIFRQLNIEDENQQSYDSVLTYGVIKTQVSKPTSRLDVEEEVNHIKIDASINTSCRG